jgi:hypothetical protein
VAVVANETECALGIVPPRIDLENIIAHTQSWVIMPRSSEVLSKLVGPIIANAPITMIFCQVDGIIISINNNAVIHKQSPRCVLQFMEDSSKQQ